MKAFYRKYRKKDGSLSWYPIIKHKGKQYCFKGWPYKYMAEDRAKTILELVASSTATDEEVSALLYRLSKDTYKSKRESILFQEYCERWFKTKKDWKESTRLSYSQVFNSHIIPTFKDHYLEDISILDVQEWINELSKNMNAGTVHKCFRYFRAAMKQAEAWEMISKSPTQKINLPRRQVEELKFLKPDEILRVIQVSQRPENYLFATLAMSGLRLGEALALRWGDIDNKKACIRVTRSWSRSGGFQEPKTPSSRRAVPLVPSLKNLLGELYHFAGRPDPEALVFSRGENPLDPGNTRREFYRALAEVETDHVTIHSLRHTYASLMLANGASIKALQHALGHSSATMTLNIYSHLIQEDIDGATKRAELAWRIPSGKVIPFPSQGET